ncbi:hypothetical protein [Halanaerobium salsuginis]|jgi:hypothetical protein|uniref:Uncharacterized protein n=1 Tax=Halanaerobium salsuginis TaxID=29563 RepID=A0A1I4L5V4_9FIRM|nr:hypothetical protein [Halanaerobium salsuginis]SFL86037.1 hypothetical protein SAMN02983006_02214 [Halanaerobium salsuginis]
MDSLDKFDLKLVLSFTNAYRKLHQEGQITQQQLTSVLALVENYQQFSPAEFETKLQNIFPDSNFLTKNES